ncbi:hypothetical protein PGTUg99_012105 [Puccinia graminis f. sp. tritici]|uniref:Secreted protein n=1 Tax=Puccinia graminis f. sp. tritici TaxID=56615 RepID=A0A5B0N787_PUCGR|nr:hypothetical protein PGTUg99_012105 [Puccinia graminis f. sp. tritici]
MYCFKLALTVSVMAMAYWPMAAAFTCRGKTHKLENVSGRARMQLHCITSQIKTGPATHPTRKCHPACQPISFAVLSKSPMPDHTQGNYLEKSPILSTKNAFQGVNSCTRKSAVSAVIFQPLSPKPKYVYSRSFFRHQISCLHTLTV